MRWSSVGLPVAVAAAADSGLSADTEAKFCAALRSLLEIVDEELRHRYPPASVLTHSLSAAAAAAATTDSNTTNTTTSVMHSFSYG